MNPVLVMHKESIPPIVSASLRCLTKMLFLWSYRAAFARESVTDNGKLSGKATSMVKVTKIASTNSCNV